MKLLMTHRYFWPDTSPYGALMRSIAEGLSDDLDVSVFTASLVDKSHKSTVLADVQVTRCSVLPENRFRGLARAINTIIYSVALFFHVLRNRPDWVTAATFPPVLAAWSASLAARLVGAKFVYHVQDIHPEVSRISGGRLGTAPAYQILRWLDNQTMRRAFAVVTLSQDMYKTLIARGGDPAKCHVLNNFQQEHFETTVQPPAELVKPDGMRRVIFAGNLGRFQNLETLADGIASCLPEFPDLELFFLGSGALKNTLRHRYSSNNRIKFAPFLPLSQANILIADADIALVSLSEGMHRVAYPSKLLTYAGLGVPMLALVDPKSDLARTVKNNQLGVAVSEQTAEGVSHALKQLLSKPMHRDDIQRWYSQNSDKNAALAFWRDLLLGRMSETC